LRKAPSRKEFLEIGGGGNVSFVAAMVYGKYSNFTEAR
jgi:hypothetical protein